MPIIIHLALCLVSLFGADDDPVDPTGRLTRENLAPACDVWIRKVMTQWSEIYEFTPEQVALLNVRLAELKEQQIRYSLTTAAERWQAAEQARVVYRQNGTRPADTEPLPQYTDLKAFARKLSEGNPLYNQTNLRAEVERHMSPEQLSRAHKKLTRLADEQHVKQEKESLLMDQAMHGHMGTSAMAKPDGWEYFVRQFCQAFALSDAQEATAMSILRDSVQQRDQYLDSHWSEWDQDLRGTYTGQDSPIDRVESIWKRMQQQLDGLPTEQQMTRAIDVHHQSGRTWTPEKPTQLVFGRSSDFALRELRSATSRPASAPESSLTTQPAAELPVP